MVRFDGGNKRGSDMFVPRYKQKPIAVTLQSSGCNSVLCNVCQKSAVPAVNTFTGKSFKPAVIMFLYFSKRIWKDILK